jgi:TrmH family RNA methyltransferase
VFHFDDSEIPEGIELEDTPFSLNVDGPYSVNDKNADLVDFATVPGRGEELEIGMREFALSFWYRPHYPENVGACCRAMKTMGFTKAGIVRPSRLALPTHPMAQKMAVKSGDILEAAEIFDNIDEAIVGADIVVGTTARMGVSGVLTPRSLGPRLVEAADLQRRIVILFGNEKSGLSSKELERCDLLLRVPIAALQPSLNLAQAMQVITYELFCSALAEREHQAKEARE